MLIKLWTQILPTLIDSTYPRWAGTMPTQKRHSLYTERVQTLHNLYWHMCGINAKVYQTKFTDIGVLTWNLWFNTLAWTFGIGINNLWSILIETWTQWWPIANEVEIFAITWHTVEEGIQWFREMKTLEEVSQLLF